MDSLPLAGENIWRKTKLLKYSYLQFVHDAENLPASKTSALYLEYIREIKITTEICNFLIDITSFYS